MNCTASTRSLTTPATHAGRGDGARSGSTSNRPTSRRGRDSVTARLFSERSKNRRECNQLITVTTQPGKKSLRTLRLRAFARNLHHSTSVLAKARRRKVRKSSLASYNGPGQLGISRAGAKEIQIMNFLRKMYRKLYGLLTFLQGIFRRGNSEPGSLWHIDNQTMTLNEQLEFLIKGTVDVIPIEELKKKLETAAASGRKLRVKLGCDPTAPDIHIGHSVVIRKMKAFQELGHDVIFLIGDFTAMIGDPTGRNTTRPPLTREQIEENAETYKSQIFKLLDSGKTIIEFNSKWLNAFKPEDFIRLTAKVTLAQMLERDDFSKRYASGVPISVHELLYPLAQGYDSVALNADVELGGTDQKFNLLMAREIQRAYDVEPQVIMTTPLLEGLDGVEKMSKSKGNYIGITESPDEIYGKAMSISDDLMWRYYELLTDLTPGEIAKLKSGVESGARHPRDVKSELAKKLVTDFHSRAEADRAEAEFIRRFRERQTPTDVETRVIKSDSRNIKLVDLMTQIELAPSKAEARRLISQGGVKLNGERIGEAAFEIDTAMAKEVQLQVGKLKFLKVIFE